MVPHASAENSNSRIYVRLLGQNTIETSDTIVTQFRWSRIPALLGYLLVHEGKNSRESVAEALWPDRPPERSRQNLRQTVLYLNEVLGKDSASYLVTDRS